MVLEDYFEVLGPDDIRIKGHRIGIETVLYEYVRRGLPPEAIAERYPTLRLDEVYATILYYLRNREEMTTYLEDWIEHGEQAWAAQQQDPVAQARRERFEQARQERARQEALAATGATQQ